MKILITVTAMLMAMMSCETPTECYMHVTYVQYGNSGEYIGRTTTHSYFDWPDQDEDYKEETTRWEITTTGPVKIVTEISCEGNWEK